MIELYLLRRTIENWLPLEQNQGKNCRRTGGVGASVLSEEQTLWPLVPLRGILVVIDGFAHEWVRMYSRFRIEFPCIILQEFFDGGEVRFSMELSVPDEPRGVKMDGRIIVR
jgi:hypothetical protein